MAAGNPSPAPMPHLKLSDEEIAVLRECRRNSIYFRALPIGALSVISLRQVIKSGAFPHVLKYSKVYFPGVFCLGFVSGLMSYHQTCLHKIRSLDNSELAKITGLRPDGYDTGDQAILSGKSMNNQPYTEPGFNDELHDEVHSRREERNDGRSFTMPSPMGIQDEGPKQLEKYTSYEELRERNRNQNRQTPREQPDINQAPQKYEEESTGPKDVDDYRSPVDTYQSDISLTTWSEGNEHLKDSQWQKENPRISRKGPPLRKNAYGDVLGK